jgi:hypothetical protein
MFFSAVDATGSVALGQTVRLLSLVSMADGHTTVSFQPPPGDQPILASFLVNASAVAYTSVGFPTSTYSLWIAGRSVCVSSCILVLTVASLRASSQSAVTRSLPGGVTAQLALAARDVQRGWIWAPAFDGTLVAFASDFSAVRVALRAPACVRGLGCSLLIVAIVVVGAPFGAPHTPWASDWMSVLQIMARSDAVLKPYSMSMSLMPPPVSGGYVAVVGRQGPVQTLLVFNGECSRVPLLRC